jgi:hypothetical protein
MNKPMNRTTFAANRAMLTRRAFVRNLAWAGLAGAALPAGLRAVLAPWDRVAPLAPWAHRGAVVSFHMDRPYLDPTGTAMPYVLPRGTRSGAPLERLSEEAFRSAQCYV